MSEEQAIETEDEIETTEEITEAVETTDTEEVEIIIEGEEQPASVPLHALHKRLGRERKKTDAAHLETEEAQRKAAMLEEENKLLRLQAQQTQPTKRPIEDDFDTVAEYNAALEDYEDARITSIAEKKASEIIQANQTQTAQSVNEGNLNQLIDKHYERSAELKVPDYSETESAAADVLGDDIAKQIVANTDDSHLLMYFLGKNPAKAEGLKALIESNPMKGVMEIGRLAGSLKVKSKTQPAPDPETTVDGGVPTSYDERGPKGAQYS
jgi:hypothetical protein